MNDPVIHSFFRYSREALAELKNTLLLTLPEELLLYCQKHYHTAEMRDPSANELQMLSALSAHLECAPDAEGIYEIETEDEEYAKTYADAMQKRGVHNAIAAHPPTLAELSVLASKEVCRTRGVSRLPSLPEVRLCDALPFESADFSTGKDARIRLRCTEDARAGDVLVFLPAPTRPASLLPRDLAIVFSLRIGAQGILAPLVRHLDGCSLDLSAFSADGSTPPLTVLSDAIAGDTYLLCVARHQYPALCAYFEETGCPFVRLGEVTNDRRLTVSRPTAAPLSIQIPFLRALFRRRKNKIDAIKETALPAPAVKTKSIGGLTPESGVFCEAASASLPDTSFRHAILTVLAPVLSLAARGVPVGKQDLAAEFDYPRVKDCLSALLGLYRVQTELALSSCEIRLKPVKASDALYLSVYALTDVCPLPDRFVGEGSDVYLLSLPLDGTGLLCFSRLREELSLLADAAAKGLIRSARVLINADVATGLLEMGDPSFPCKILWQAEPSALPLALLIEASAPLSLPLVAKTPMRTEQN